jgi:hypothetical protein
MLATGWSPAAREGHTADALLVGGGRGQSGSRGSVAGVTLGASGEHITCHGVLGASQGWTQIDSTRRGG